MKKRFVLTIVLLICAILFGGCADRLAPPEDTNLEFWITDKVDSWNLEGYQQKYGMFGGNQYYGSGYMPTYDENDQQIDPAHCVIYTVTSYPDHASKGNAITEIYITDPKVHFYGLSLESDTYEITKVMEEKGFKSTGYMTFEKNKVRIRFGEDSITIDVEVTNFSGIQF